MKPFVTFLCPFVFASALCATTALAGESCIDEQLRIQRLLQQIAQLQANNAQLINNAATTEEKRLQAVKETEQPATAPAAPVVAQPTTEATPPAPTPTQ